MDDSGAKRRAGEKEPPSYEVYAKLPNALRPAGFPSVGADSAALDAILDVLLGRNIDSNASIVSKKLRDKALVLDQLYNRKQRTSSRGRKQGALRRLRFGELDSADATHRNGLILHDLWKAYVQQVTKDAAITSAVIDDLDLHGALIEVLSSDDPTVVKTRGVVLVDTANTVVVVSEDDSTRRILKEGTRVRIELGERAGVLDLGRLSSSMKKRGMRSKLRRHSRGSC